MIACLIFSFSSFINWLHFYFPFVGSYLFGCSSAVKSMFGRGLISSICLYIDVEFSISWKKSVPLF